jgi:hypothetical protein
MLPVGKSACDASASSESNNSILFIYNILNPMGVTQYNGKSFGLKYVGPHRVCR